MGGASVTVLGPKPWSPQLLSRGCAPGEVRKVRFSTSAEVHVVHLLSFECKISQSLIIFIQRCKRDVAVRDRELSFKSETKPRPFDAHWCTRRSKEQSGVQEMSQQLIPFVICRSSFFSRRRGHTLEHTAGGCPVILHFRSSASV